MNERRTTGKNRWIAPAVLALASIGLIVSAAGAADRVVLGEYFTNLY